MELLSPDIIMNLLLTYGMCRCAGLGGEAGRPVQQAPGQFPDPPEALNELSDISKPRFPGRKTEGRLGTHWGLCRTVQCLHFLEEVCRGWWVEPVGGWVGGDPTHSPAQGLPQGSWADGTYRRP